MQTCSNHRGSPAGGACNTIDPIHAASPVLESAPAAFLSVLLISTWNFPWESYGEAPLT